MIYFTVAGISGK